MRKNFFVILHNQNKNEHEEAKFFIHSLYIRYGNWLI